MDKQAGGKEMLKITIKNTAPGGQTPAQEGIRAKFIKPKSPEVGKWKKNEANARYKKIKPTFDMWLNKYTRQAASSYNRQSHLNHPRSPPREMYSQVREVVWAVDSRVLWGDTSLRATLLRWR